MRKPTTIAAGLALILAILACNLPSGQQTPAAVMTAAALTVQAQLSPSPEFRATDTFTPAAAATTASPATVPPANSPTPVCDLAQFVKDVTIPDGTKMTPGQNFTKTWRLRNIGACTWSGYNLIFDSGDLMGGSSPIAISTVNPGQEVDLSVDLTAPAGDGNYRGYWRIRNTSGVLVPVANGYQGQSFYADIKVKNNSGGSTHTVDLPYLASESGLVLSGGSINPATVAAGDSSSNQAVQAFLSFDISAIPAGSTIQTASIKLKGGSQVRGDPFTALGCLRAYAQNFGTVDAGDFVSGAVTGAIGRWCSAGDLTNAWDAPEFVSGVQSAVGDSRFQMRLEFNQTQTNGDGGIDDVLILAPVTLTVKYTAP